MKEIEIKPGFVMLYDDEDHNLVMSRKWSVNNSGYVSCGGSRNGFLFHRKIMPPPEAFECHHVDGNKLNN